VELAGVGLDGGVAEIDLVKLFDGHKKSVAKDIELIIGRFLWVKQSLRRQTIDTITPPADYRPGWRTLPG